MLAVAVRSGLVETIHDGTVAVVDTSGALVVHAGEIDRPFFFRSAAKPFQAAACQMLGAGLNPLQLALACASHDGHPVQVALVEEILAAWGFAEADLGCPPAWPLAGNATRRLALAGHREPRRLWHNCSGKHAAMLAACRARDWDPATYLRPEHPLQVAITELMSEVAGDVEPRGVDGCGAPVFRTTARRLATAYGRLATAPELAEVFGVMHSYPALVSGTGHADTAVATWLDAAAKGGAAGCMGAALRGRLGIGIKCWDGSGAVAGVALLAVLEALSAIPAAARRPLEAVARPGLLGGGERAGMIEPRLELHWS